MSLLANYHLFIIYKLSPDLINWQLILHSYIKHCNTTEKKFRHQLKMTLNKLKTFFHCT